MTQTINRLFKVTHGWCTFLCHAIQITIYLIYTYIVWYSIKMQGYSNYASTIICNQTLAILINSYALDKFLVTLFKTNYVRFCLMYNGRPNTCWLKCPLAICSVRFFCFIIVYFYIYTNKLTNIF